MILIVLLFWIQELLKDLESITRVVHKGCLISPFLFLVAELLSVQIINILSILGLNIFDREVNISQLADATALFLKDKSQSMSLVCLLVFSKLFAGFLVH